MWSLDFDIEVYSDVLHPGNFQYLDHNEYLHGSSEFIVHSFIDCAQLNLPNICIAMRLMLI